MHSQGILQITVVLLVQAVRLCYITRFSIQITLTLSRKDFKSQMAISTSSLVYALFLSAMISINIAGNSLVCLMILKKKEMKTSINWLLFHLAIADSLVAVFFICIMGYLYAQIILCLRSRVFVTSSAPQTVSRSKDKVTKILISVSVIFIACWTPPAVLCVLSPMIPGGYATVYPVTTASALLNSCLNPLVYTLHSQQFRKNLSSVVSCSKNKQPATYKTNGSGIKSSRQPKM